MELALSARYDKARATASLKAHSSGSASESTLLDAEADVDALDVRAFFAGGDLSRLPWKASARAHFAGFPLEAIGPLDDKRISGQLSGDASLSKLHEDASADCTLTVDSLRVGSVGYRSTKIKLKADGHVLDGSVRVDQADGFAEAHTHVTSSWGSALAPSVQPSTPLVVSLASKNFRLAGLLPFVDGVLDELDGRIDSDARIEFDPVAKATRLGGSVTLSRGAFETAAGGGEFHDVTATVKFSPDGVVTLEKLSAHGLTGMLQAAATARLDGGGLRAVKGVIVIPTHAAIPMSVSGIEVGNIDGRLEVSATTSEDGHAMDLVVDVPRLRVVLPEGISTSVQALGPMDKVQLGAHRGSPATFVLLPGPRRKSDRGSPGRTTVAVHLGDVEVVRGTDLKVDLDGQLKANPGSSMAVTGQIRLKQGGTISVQGKRFTVDSGTVTLVGPDPSNPEIVVKAGWTAPDGTVVYATFTGPLRTGKVTLSSEPKLSQQEIVELLLFGTSQGPQAQSMTASTQNSAVGTVGGEAAQPLNHALNQIGLGSVSANVDTTNSANPKPEVEVQIARDISLQVAVVLGQVPPGVNPDHTLLTVDWRLLSRWSLASTVGDAGTTIFDLLWQRRY
jgi:translocation and assembly module TamB